MDFLKDVNRISNNWIISYEAITWEYTQEEMKTAYNEFLDEQIANEYQRLRQAEYPALEEQLDMIYHNWIDAWKSEIKKVKDKYPKPE